MYRKIISVMSVALMVFLCSQFSVFAVTGGGKTIVSNSYSYNNGDVTVFVRVNGQAAEELYEGQHYYPHNFTVTLANNTNEFQVADTNNFSVDLYSGSANAFASNQNSWGAEVTSYSDNMTVPRITMYSSGDLAGHVLVAFNDSDLLVLNPNETRTYNFSINFIQTENVNYTPLNGNFRYSYFTYTGTVGFYARPTSFTGNTIENFINNDSLPNSAIAYYQYLIEQGIEDQELFTNIIDLLTWYNANINFGVTQSSGVYSHQETVLDIIGLRIRPEYTVLKPILLSSDVDINNINSNLSYNINTDRLYCVPIYYTLKMYTFNSTSGSLNNDPFLFRVNNSLSVSGANYVGMDYEIVTSEGLTLYNFDNFYHYFIGDSYPMYFSNHEYKVITYRFNYYYLVSDYSTSVDSIPTLSGNITITQPVTYTFNTDNINSDSIINRVLSEIRNKLQDILNSYNTNAPAAENVTDTSESTQDILTDQHDIESGYFEDTQTYINDTGIQNFQFDPAITGGLGGVKDDFTAVWTSCGTLAQYWIASLTIGLALSIIRHRRMFSK